MTKLVLAAVLALCLAACSDDTVLKPDSTVKRDSPPTQLDGKKDAVKATDGVKTEGKVPDKNLIGSCPTCNADEVCVQILDGTCTSMGVKCQKVSTSCKTCSSACDVELCGVKDGGPKFTCQAAPCTGKEIPGAVHCYGM